MARREARRVPVVRKRRPTKPAGTKSEVFMVPEVGLEPTLAEANTALNRARLPIPPLRRGEARRERLSAPPLAGKPRRRSHGERRRAPRSIIRSVPPVPAAPTPHTRTKEFALAAVSALAVLVAAGLAEIALRAAQPAFLRHSRVEHPHVYYEAYGWSLRRGHALHRPRRGDDHRQRARVPGPRGIPACPWRGPRAS